MSSVKNKPKLPLAGQPLACLYCLTCFLVPILSCLSGVASVVDSCAVEGAVRRATNRIAENCNEGWQGFQAGYAKDGKEKL